MTRKRYEIYVLLTLVILFNYAGRSQIAITIMPMADEFSWDYTTRSLILSSFFYGYLPAQVPSGLLVQRLGAGIVWGLILISTPLYASSLGIMITTRIISGLIQGCVFPSVTSIASVFCPSTERAAVSSFITLGVHIGSTISIILPMHFLKQYDSWHLSFYVFGALCMGYSGVWHFLGANTPEQYKRISSKELNVILEGKSGEDEEAMNLKKMSKSSDSEKSMSTSFESQMDSKKSLLSSEDEWSTLKRFFCSKTIWCMALSQYCNQFCYFIMLFWMPQYMKEFYNIELSGYYYILPYLAPAPFGLIIGLLCDFLVKRRIFSIGGSRNFQLVFGALSCSLFLCLLGTHAPTIEIATVLITLASAFSSITSNVVYATAMDIAPTKAGLVLGFANVGSILPGITAVILTGALLDSYHNWQMIFFLGAGHAFISIFIWIWGVNSSKSLEL